MNVIKTKFHLMNFTSRILMQKHFYQIASTPESTNLQSFIVFDGVMPVAEGSEPTVFFSRFPTDIHQPHFAVNQVGLLLTFLRFATRFAGDTPCDYIRTSSHETAILELDNQVWMSVQRQISPNSPSNRDLLNSMLRSCKSIYQLFFQPPKRNPETEEILDESAVILKKAFEVIVNSITWADLGFIHLFDSFFQLKLNDQFSSELCPIIHRLLNSDVPIAHIAIMYSRYFIFYTFPTDVARTLSICLRMKLPYLFPRVLAKEDERLYWIIGMSKTERRTVSIYAPPLFIDGKQYPLIALRMKKIRFILTLQSGVIPSPKLLAAVPPLLKPLRKHCEKLKLETRSGKKSGPYVVLKNLPQEKMLTLSHEKLSDPTIPIAENMIFQAHLFATNVAQQKSSIVFPGPSGLGYYVCLRKTIAEEVVVMCQNDTKEVTRAISAGHELERQENVKRPYITV
ncbi:hypothetical protein TRFO_34576 [Tritrichomonas foetus]|uniref:CCZ1/INTU/HSP4 first Longin domain-containing protein n=1 Tax=Tritrichomonas foetus TaxID=1144522 RepID=A0A1J4JIT3_9EUKA|nr:hypothetical protein TRFO_34576 [Tritrichomonas foetus]|eukprot:OHS99088.1 hypothetical protein TRFO_34576 [Tritrichomonas foetus]